MNWLGCGVQVWGSWFDYRQRQQSHLFSEWTRGTLRPIKVFSSSGNYDFIPKCKETGEWSWSLDPILFRYPEGVELNLHFPVFLHGVQGKNFTFLLFFIIRTFLLSNCGLKLHEFCVLSSSFLRVAPRCLGRDNITSFCIISELPFAMNCLL